MASTSNNNNNGPTPYNIYQQRQEAERQREQAREIMQQQQSGEKMSAIYHKLYTNLSNNEKRAVNRGNNPAFLQAVYAKMQRPGGRRTRRHRSKSRRSKSRRLRR